MISGIVTGAVIAFAWAVAFLMYLRRRIHQTHKAHKAGYRSRREVLRPPKKPTKFIIPPDPAVVHGGREPGEIVYPVEQAGGHGTLKKVKTEPLASEKENVNGNAEGQNGSRQPHHTNSAPPGLLNT